ncbi:MAG: MBL fold metallo-hydrolase RNA specificity domain-containing protein [Candidatus Obscuribacterales bacterium]
MRKTRPERKTSPSQPPKIKIHTLGAAGEVTGSLNLVEVIDGPSVTRFLLDVGMHQENDNINKSHRLPRGITAGDIDFVIISHAHIDHSGYLPKLIKDGFRGFAYTHAATRDLLRFLLPDSGRLQELAADRENAALKGGGRRVKPLYTAAEARSSLSRIKVWSYGRNYQMRGGITVKLTEACHILGAAVVTVTIGSGKAKKTICFTGNVGRADMPIIGNLQPVRQADLIISESTYGNKLHQKRDRLEHLAALINRAYRRAKNRHREYGYGVITIPAFAVGRVQTVLYDLRELMAAGRIPEIPVFVDSPMAIEATKVHRKHKNLYNHRGRTLVDAGIDPFATPRYKECRRWSDSRALDKPAREPVIVIGSSGMAAGGRILAHLEKRLPGSNNSVIFVGYQGTGVLGHTLVNEKPSSVLIHGKPVEVRATVEYMSDYSGHADYSEIIAWLKQFAKRPERLLLVHGDPDALSQFRQHIKTALPGWKVNIPHSRQSFEL